MIRSLCVLAAFFLLTNSCVSPYYVEAEYKPMIVIEGNITDQPGPYEVILSKTLPVWPQYGETEMITGATVIIEDDHGNQEALSERTTGHYYTNALQGQIGYSYTLHVKTSEGNEYKSDPEKLSSVGDFTLNHSFQTNDPTNDQSQYSKNGFNVTVDSEVLPEQEGRVWWRVHGTYHIYTYAFWRVKPAERGFGYVPDPPRCSGYITSPSGILYIGNCTCCDCWIDEYNAAPLISDPHYTKNGNLHDVSVFFINVNRRSFYDKYYLEVEQFNPSQKVYDFWKAVKKQESNSSNLFQVPPPVAHGNVYAVSENAIPAIGYFAASAVKKHIIVLSKPDVPYEILPIDTIKQNCLDNYRYSTKPHIVSNVKPLFW